MGSPPLVVVKSQKESNRAERLGRRLSASRVTCVEGRVLSLSASALDDDSHYVPVLPADHSLIRSILSPYTYDGTALDALHP